MSNRILQIAACTLALPAAIIAKPSADLERLTPVPADQAIPIGDFLRPALLQQPTMNRSGTGIAAIVTAGEDRHLLLVYDLRTKKYQTLGGTGDYDIIQTEWLGNTRVAYALSAQKLFGIGLFAADVKNLSETYPLLEYFGSSIIGIPRSDPLSPLVWNRYDGLRNAGQDEGVALINSSKVSNIDGANILTTSLESMGKVIEEARENNQRHILHKYPLPPGTVVSYITDKDDNLEFAITSTNDHKSLYRLAAEDAWVKCPADVENGYFCGAGNGAGQLAMVPGHTEGSPNPLFILDATTGKRGEILVESKDYDFNGWPYRDPAGQIIGARDSHEYPYNIWFTPQYQKYQDLLNRSFPGVFVKILGSNDEQTLFLIVTYSDRQPPRYSWVDFKAHAAGLFKDSQPWIDPKRMQATAAVKFRTRDGKVLDAYLTLPAGTSKDHPAPMVVIPHGGPYMRDSWGYDGEAQLFASRGYAVLKPNYRASSGYEWKFSEADLFDFVKMSHDVTDATKAMIASGLVDRDRIAIIGGSFGGYLAIKGVEDEPSLYRCAVGISGVYDWEQLIKDKKYDATQYDSTEYGWLLRHLGDPRREPAKFDEIAPTRHVDRIRVPIWISHGGQDYNVDLGQSTRLISELKQHNVPHETFIVGNEGHGMYYFANRVEQYKRIEAFLATNMAPRTNTSAQGTTPPSTEAR